MDPAWGQIPRERLRPHVSHVCHMFSSWTTNNDDTTTKLNKDRCIKLALAHDMAECIVGDVTPSDRVSKEEKHRQEKQAMEQLAELAGEEAGKELYELWEEYEFQKTPEANFVKDVDRFEMVLQAHEYENVENGLDGCRIFLIVPREIPASAC